MRIAIWVVLAVLVALHHDYWFWNDSTLVWDWMPVGLLYHIGLSLVAVAFWAVAVRFAWPQFLDSDDANGPEQGSTSEGASS
jgi:hypothetical protein